MLGSGAVGLQEQLSAGDIAELSSALLPAHMPGGGGRRGVARGEVPISMPSRHPK